MFGLTTPPASGARQYASRFHATHRQLRSKRRPYRAPIKFAGKDKQ